LAEDHVLFRAAERPPGIDAPPLQRASDVGVKVGMPAAQLVEQPSGSFNSAVLSRNARSSISTALASRFQAPFRKISVGGSSTADR
jgi:hypothetical protein